MVKILENYMNVLDSSTKFTENELCWRCLLRPLSSGFDKPQCPADSHFVYQKESLKVFQEIISLRDY